MKFASRMTLRTASQLMVAGGMSGRTMRIAASIAIFTCSGGLFMDRSLRGNGTGAAGSAL